MQHFTQVSKIIVKSLSDRGLPPDGLSQQLRYLQPLAVRGWCDGSRLPRPEQLAPLATALHTSHVSLALAYLSDLLPELANDLGEARDWLSARRPFEPPKDADRR